MINTCSQVKPFKHNEDIDDDEVDNMEEDDVDEGEVKEVKRAYILEIQIIGHTNAKKIVVEVIASLPHSLSKALVKTISKKASTKLVVVSTPSQNTQPIPISNF